MKNLLVFLMVFAVIGTASATFVNNGEFTADAAGWEAAGGGLWVADHNTVGGNPGGYVTLSSPLWAVWFGAPYTFYLGEAGIPAGTTINVDVDFITNVTPNPNLLPAVKLESWDSVEAAGGAYPQGLLDDLTVFYTPTTSWTTSNTGNYLINTLADGFKVVLIAAENQSNVTTGYDNVKIYITGGTPALFPVPWSYDKFHFDGAGVDPCTTTSLSWTNPPGTTDANAYLLASDVNGIVPNLGPTVFDPCVVTLVVDGGLESASVSLDPNKYYYWAVHAYVGEDVNSGYTWRFQTRDTVPTVDAGTDQYLVATASPMVIILDANVTDDNPGVTYLWTDITAAADKDPATSVVLSTPTVEDTNVTLTNATGSVSGWYQFTLTVTDSIGQVSNDSVTVGVYDTCHEMAVADPCETTITTNWPDGDGDIDGDCHTDFYDFALFAGSYLECMIDCP